MRIAFSSVSRADCAAQRHERKLEHSLYWGFLSAHLLLCNMARPCMRATRLLPELQTARISVLHPSQAL